MSIEEVRALVAERQRYDDWLASLEAKRADTPPRVFERVHGDYLARRTDVSTRLQAHVGGLSAFGAELEQRLSELEGRLSSHEEELAEGMLRNLVGEYDNERWDAVRHDIEAKIDTLGNERGVLLAEVEDVRALLSSAGVPATPAVEATVEPTVEASIPTPLVNVAPAATRLAATPLVVPALESVSVVDAAPAMSPTPAVVEPVVDVVPDESEAMHTDGMMIKTIDVEVPASSYMVGHPFETPASTAAAAAADDSLLDIDMQAMVDNPVPQGQSHEDVLADVAAMFDTSSITAVPDSPAAAAPRAPIDQQELDDALAMFGEATGRADRQFVQSLQGIQPEHDTRQERATETATPNSAPRKPADTDDSFDDLAFLRSVIDREGAQPSSSASTGAMSASSPTGEPQKTLRCTECSTMNLPTEWYCERCGGELAAF